MSPTVQDLEECLLNINDPIGKRTRAVFYLRTINTSQALQVLLKALGNKNDSELMRHELAYVIGQMQNNAACQALIDIVQDITDDGMVRHEAAEALGAIADPVALPVLEKYLNDPAPEVAQTCQLSIDLIEYTSKKASGNLEEGEVDKNPYLSVDPAPAAEQSISTPKLRTILLDTNESLFNRYRAMFSLRNRNDKDAALALADAFDDESKLFRHEIAYVMGQMENPHTIPSLHAVLENASEHRMVRHEAAEALGAIGNEECQKILQKYMNDDSKVVAESCQVALDAMDYWQTKPPTGRNI